MEKSYFYSICILFIICLGMSAKAKDKLNVNDQYTLQIAGKAEYNKLIVVFSDFDIPPDNKGEKFLYTNGFERDTEIDDSVEGMNRCFFVVNDVLFLWLFRPIMRGYFCIVPKSGRTGIKNIAENVEFPARSLSCLLQGRYRDSGIVLWRFLINTVLGGAGAYDIADDVWGIKKRDEDMGQAFASWGIGHGCYLYLPVQGPSSVRDGVGLVFDYALDPKTYAPVPGIQSFATFNKAALRLDDYLKLVDSFSDPYVVLKTLWHIQRSVKVNIDK